MRIHFVLSLKEFYITTLTRTVSHILDKQCAEFHMSIIDKLGNGWALKKKHSSLINPLSVIFKMSHLCCFTIDGAGWLQHNSSCKSARADS